MKIAIIGCGYVGKFVARFWQQAGHQLTLTTTTPSKVEQLQTIAEQVLLLPADSPQAWQKAIAGQEVILLTVGAKNRHDYEQAYLKTAQNLREALKTVTGIRQIIYTGSYAVLGNQAGNWVDETCPVSPPNENAKILAQTEKILLQRRNPSLKVCILRLAGIYGPDREILKIFKSWAGTTRSGTGKDYTNWIHVEDIVRGIELARAKQLDGIYNLANDTPLTQQQLFDTMCQRHNLPAIKWKPAGAAQRPYNSRLSIAKIKAAGLELAYPETLI
ncbi:MAG: SDR family oxidoreductase [Cyanobacteria bacterium J083]|nr:MAG: SDR family oxidoreductase [Cyanobacteria bacterium J083]